MANPEILPVLFRFDAGDVTAVFPTLAADQTGALMTCYAHIGQHSACSFGWYRGTRPAKPDEYADLLQELRSIYETGPDAVTLRRAKRITHAMDKARRAMARA